MSAEQAMRGATVPTGSVVVVEPDRASQTGQGRIVNVVASAR